MARKAPRGLTSWRRGRWREYSDFELTHSFINAGKSEGCDRRRPLRRLTAGRSRASSRPGTAAGGRGDQVPLAVWPEGGECVVALNARISEEADRRPYNT